MKKNIAIILESIPIIFGIISYLCVFKIETNSIITSILFLITFLGFLFFFIGRKLDKKDKVVKVLGILDLLCTFFIIIFYIIVIFLFGL